MTPHYAADGIVVHQADCIDFMRQLPDSCVDSIVCDPPYGLGFMGKGWDDLPPGLDWAKECLRVLKPGGHILAFGGTRTWHRLAVAVEDAGFEIRDSIAWMYGSGFPKSLDVSKAIDKQDAVDLRTDRALRFTAWMREHLTARQIDEATGTNMGGHYTTAKSQPAVATMAHLDALRPLLPEVPGWVEEMCQQRTVESETFKGRAVVGSAEMVDTSRSRLGFAGELYGGDGSTRVVDITAPATPDAERWQGWGTALKPAFEPVVVGRKPLIGTVAANVLAHGTGGLNIDACRIEGEPWKAHDATGLGSVKFFTEGEAPVVHKEPHTAGRWPANVVLDESQAAALDEQSGTSRSRVGKPRGADSGDGWGMTATGAEYDDKGGASRFFYVAKAPTKERPKVDGVAHPTVKPLTLMRWLVRLVTPPGGVVLEPFAGSGTTVEACILEGFRCIAIEREAEYLPLILDRIGRATEGAA